MTAQADIATKAGKPGQGMRVALFATCINDTMMPGAPEATVRLLERLGCSVEFPRSQTCCGQILTNTGYFDEAVVTARAYVRAFSDYDYIVRPSGSCIASVRHQHPRARPPRARYRVGARLHGGSRPQLRTERVPR